MPACTVEWTTIASSAQAAFKIGCAAIVRQSAAMNTGRGETSNSARTASSEVASTVRNVVTCGIEAACSILRAIVRRIGETVTRSASR